MDTPLWALRLGELELRTMTQNCLSQHARLDKAWHAAALCDQCLLRIRQFGTQSLTTLRYALHVCGFPRAPARCAWREWRQGRGWVSACEEDLAVCRRLLEQGDWSWLHA